MARLLLPAAITATVIGMMLVIAGVLVRGMFLPGVLLIGVGLVGHATAAVLHIAAPARRGDAV
jgi:hypothetical protein